MKRILRWARPVGLVAVVAVAVLAFAGGATAASPTFSGSVTSKPSGVAVPYSAVGAPTYVQFTTTFARTSLDTSSLTHATINEPVTADANNNPVNATFPGQIVALSSTPNNCAATYRDSNTGVACDFGSLKAGAVITLTVVVQMPQSTSGILSFNTMAALTVKEGGNDSQPQSSYTDTFFTGAGTPLATALTATPSDDFESFTLPGATGNFTYSTSGGGSGNNYQRSGVKWSGGDTFPGGTLTLVECGGPKTDSPSCSLNTANPCGAVTCTTQTSIVLVPGSQSFFTTLNPLTITLTFFASELGTKFNLSQFTIYHDGAIVSSCKKPITDPKGDCVVSLLQDKTTGDVTAIITGPANGGWGGAG